MRCPKCAHPETRVIDSRVGRNGTSIRRRRQCEKCEYRFSTLEEVVREGLVVIKRDGRREDFDREKLRAGIRRACEKRPVNAEQIDLLISDILVELQGRYENEVPSLAIGEVVMERLRQIDHVAYVRFASVYREFRDPSDFARMVEELRTSPLPGGPTANPPK